MYAFTADDGSSRSSRANLQTGAIHLPRGCHDRNSGHVRWNPQADPRMLDAHQAVPTRVLRPAKVALSLKTRTVKAEAIEAFTIPVMRESATFCWSQSSRRYYLMRIQHARARLATSYMSGVSVMASPRCPPVWMQYVDSPPRTLRQIPHHTQPGLGSHHRGTAQET